MGISPFAWFAAGLADMFITWRACFHETPFGEAATHDGARALYYLSTFFLLAVAAIAAVWSYRNWHRLSGLRRLMQAEARDRAEFMALGGLFISFTLGVGIVWMCLPLFLIQMCLRAR
jgi:hypothetical protein